ncbi:hypothetical protein Nepgr_002306 [Nepenthes gracilis]|uniref:Golgin candidate 4 n=1 Tax=Nepenthes gracilis TaxID=150966 RepID=A0AAD3RWS1_NEPGR|nr:hypothetical protein Nepgr_002306 [Nepenthes gracilis]
MWSSIADLKENLNKIAHDVHNDDEGLPINGLDDGHDSTYSDRRFSHSFSNSKSASVSPMANGITPAYNSEIEQYKADIKKLRESEAEIKALSVNYATLLREKEDQIARLNQENGSLRKNLENASRGSTASPNLLKGIGDQSPNRQHKLAAQVKNRPTANQWHTVVPKQDGHNNGFAYAIQADPESNYLNSRGSEKELVDLLEEKNRSLAAIQASYELQIQQLRVDLEKEQERSASIQLKLQDEQKLRHSFQEELNSLKLEHDKASIEINRLCEELNDKVLEIKRLQIELDRREDQEADGMDGLKRVVATLEEEKMKLKEELEAAVKASTSSSAANIISDASGTVNKQLNSLDEIGHALGSSLVKGELDRSLQKLEKDLKETCRQRDKALQELARLKQHLLDKESEESEKMDEDGKIIEELRQNVGYQKATIVNLERALQQAYANQEEVKSINNSELQKSKEIIDDLKEKLSGCMRMIDAKNVELLNLQTALGQYYAEIEAKEHLEGDLYVAREECIKLSQLLKDSNEQVEVSRREKDEILAKLAQVETVVSEAKSRVNKLEEDNVKLQRALEQSMTRLNRMSMDSDFLVDRRIVIKLLVTYFQRNHSKEVLDLMVRMLGFTDEDKQRIGIAQQGAGKGAVRGVLGLPGRLVGGILSRSSSGEQINASSENQSFADLWVDFLLTESEKRERRESMDSAGGTKGSPHVTSPSATADPPPPDHRSSEMKHTAVFLSIQKPPLDQASRTPYNYPSIQQYEHTGSEFSTVPLTRSQNNSWSQK